MVETWELGVETPHMCPVGSEWLSLASCTESLVWVLSGLAVTGAEVVGYCQVCKGREDRLRR